MPWQSLGLVVVAWSWRDFPLPVMGNGLIRIKSDFEFPSVSGLVLGEHWEGMGYRQIEELRPVENAYSVVGLPLPAVAVEAGYSIRRLSVRYSNELVPYEGAISCAADLWIPSIVEGIPYQLIDGGTYG